MDNFPQIETKHLLACAETRENYQNKPLRKPSVKNKHYVSSANFNTKLQ